MSLMGADPTARARVIIKDELRKLGADKSVIAKCDYAIINAASFEFEAGRRRERGEVIHEPRRRRAMRYPGGDQ